MELDSHVDIQF